MPLFQYRLSRYGFGALIAATVVAGEVAPLAASNPLPSRIRPSGSRTISLAFSNIPPALRPSPGMTSGALDLCTSGRSQSGKLAARPSAILETPTLPRPKVAAAGNVGTPPAIVLEDVPLAFIENKGQVDSQAAFYMATGSQTLWLTSEGIVFDLLRVNPVPATRRALPERLVVRQQLIGARADLVIEGQRGQQGIYNYLVGENRSKWHTGVRSYAEVLYRNVYDGIDLKLYAKGRDLEQEFIVHPGADPNQIRVGYEGIRSLAIASDGSAVIETDFGEMRESPPHLYQTIGNRKVIVEGRFELVDEATYGFGIGAYDPTQTLVIDPTVIYSTYLGGSGEELGYAIAVDGAGHAYVAGATASIDFPVEEALQDSRGPGGTFGSFDGFVTKLNSSGDGLVYSTYFGGNNQDETRGVAVDQFGNVHLVGLTHSTDLPKVNAIHDKIGADADAFVAKLNASGSGLIYSTYLGGGGRDFATAVAVDSIGNAYVTGSIYSSPDFPTTPGAFQVTYGGGTGFLGGDAFVTKLAPTGLLVYSTYLGRSSDEVATAIAVDGAGRAHVTGVHKEGDFPITAGAFQTVPGSFGLSEAFVTKFNPSGSGLEYSTFLGGNGFDNGNGIAVDNAGHAYVTGVTSSTNFPTANPFQPMNGGADDVFVTKLSTSGTALIFSTYLGGDAADLASAIDVDGFGEAYVAGQTWSTDFPAVDPFQPRGFGLPDAFVAKLSSLGSSLVYSSHLGGTQGASRALGIGIDAVGNAFLTGVTSAPDFTTTLFAFDRGFNGAGDVFVTKLSRVADALLSLSDIVPTKGGDTGSVSVVVHGTGFMPGATARLVGPDQIDATEIIVTDQGRTMAALFDLTGRTPGIRDLEVTNPDGTTATLADAFTIEVGGGEDLWVDILGRDVIGGRGGTFYILYGNRGDRNVYGVPLWIRGIPASATVTVGRPITPVSLTGGQLAPGLEDVSTSLTIGEEQIIPLLLPALPAQSTGVLPISISAPEDFTLRTFLTSPWFTTLTDLDVVECLRELFQFIVRELPPGVDCLAAATDWYSQLFTAIHYPDADPEIFSLPQAFYGLLYECVISFLPQSRLVALVLEMIDVLISTPSLFEECLEMFGLTVDDVERSIRVVLSQDPNEKRGAEGVGLARHVQGNEPLRYAIFFENLVSATAPAQDVTVTDQLDLTHVDVNTVSFGPISFGDKTVTPPPGSRDFSIDVDLRPEKDLVVRVRASVDVETGLVTWRFASIDPQTGQTPEDPEVGFLPPNVVPPEGEGAVTFAVTPKPELPTGTEVINQATIVFDVNPPISTEPWLNTLDKSTPASQMAPLPPTVTTSPFTISWGGSDVGAGIRDFTVFVSDDGGPYTPFLIRTSAASSTFPGEHGHTYSFYTLARDLVGNDEPAKSVGEAATEVLLAQPNLQVSALKGKSVGGAGLPYKATDTTRNVGAGPASASATKLYLSDDVTLDVGEDTLLEPIAGRSVPGLAAGGTNTGTLTIVIPAGTSTGKHYLIADADGAGAIAESNESDNARAKIIYVGPDLRVLKLIAPALAAPGQTISVTDTTKNAGGAPTIASTTTRFYLSRNKKLDASDVLLGPGRSVPALVAGASSAVATNLTIPVGTAPGAYYLVAKADDTNLEAESRENNNVKAKVITIN
jgi:hypothetical protein